MKVLNKKGRPKHCYHIWEPTPSPQMRWCSKCKHVQVFTQEGWKEIQPRPKRVKNVAQDVQSPLWHGGT